MLIRLAFTQVCEEDIFRYVYFAVNSLYYVESGSATIFSGKSNIDVKREEVALG